jgi:single-strand DNA-binding protein
MFIDVVALDRLGEICNQYLKKGMSALVEGRLAIRKYDDKDGNKRTAVEIVASDMQMLDSKGRDDNGAGTELVGARARGPSSSFDAQDFPSDDIPF